MMVLSVGMPGMFTDWGERVIAALIGGAGASSAIVVADSLDDIAERLIVSDVQDLVIGVRQPDARLRRAVLASAKPMVVFLDDPTRGALHLIANLGHSVPDAVRLASAGCVKLMEFGHVPGALVLHPGRDGGDLSALVARIAAHLGIALDGQALADALAQAETAGLAGYLAPLTGEAATAGDPLRAAFDSLGERERAILQETLGTYASVFEGSDLTRLVWPRDMFLISDTLGQPGGTEPAMRDIDIAGKARPLIFGPYMQLFAGNWKARVVLGFSAETVHTPFTVDVATRERIAHTAFKPDAAGVYEVIVDFAIEDPDRPVEIRVFSERASFDGHIALGFVALTPGPVPVPQATSVDALLGGRLSA